MNSWLSFAYVRENESRRPLAGTDYLHGFLTAQRGRRKPDQAPGGAMERNPSGTSHPHDDKPVHLSKSISPSKSGEQRMVRAFPTLSSTNSALNPGYATKFSAYFFQHR